MHTQSPLTTTLSSGDVLLVFFASIDFSTILRDDAGNVRNNGNHNTFSRAPPFLVVILSDPRIGHSNHKTYITCLITRFLRVVSFSSLLFSNEYIVFTFFFVSSTRIHSASVISKKSCLCQGASAVVAVFACRFRLGRWASTGIAPTFRMLNFLDKQPYGDFPPVAVQIRRRASCILVF